LSRGGGGNLPRSSPARLKEWPEDGMIFEIGIYNARVRGALKEGERDKHLSDDWADIHYLEIDAPDEEAARSKVEKRYPPQNGFVIAAVFQNRW
jgi:hypothetical protein